MQRRKFISSAAVVTGGTLIASKTPLFSNVNSKDGDIRIIPAWDDEGMPFHHSWSGLGNIDQMRWIIRGDMQDQLDIFRDELGLKHVRAVGIFDDDLFVYANDPTNFLKKIQGDGKRPNWRSPFNIYDTLIDKGLAPIVTPCFMPSAFASGTKTVFATQQNVTPPEDWKTWEKFISNFILSLKDRYGADLLKTWYFEVWNEPNLDGFWTGGKAGYWELYKVLYSTIKNLDPDLRIGGPSTARSEWVTDLLEFGDKNNMQPDYLIGHCYNNDSANAPLSPFEGPQGDKENKSPHFLSGVVRGISKIIRDSGFEGEFHMNEWGSTWHPFSPTRESANEAAYIVKTMSEVSQEADYFAYWCLSDIYNQVGYGKETFHGNYGMMSFDGLRKPNYFAHQLLSKLGHERIPIQNNLNDRLTNTIATRSDKGVQVAVSKYCSEYHPGDHVATRKVHIRLPHGIDRNSIKVYKIDSSHNNILSEWRSIGSPVYLQKDEREILLSRNNFSATSEDYELIESSNTIEAEISMEVPGVVLLEVKWSTAG